MSEPGTAYRLSVLEERWRSDRSPRIFLQLADELRRAERTARAIEVLRDGLRWHPESVSGWVALGRILLDEGEPRAAIEAFESALERDAGQLVASKLLTESWIQVGDADRAADCLERARLLSLPDSDHEQLIAQLAELRAGGETAGIPSHERSPDAAGAGGASRPFELVAPAPLPALDFGHPQPGRRGWRKVEVASEPFVGLLGFLPPAANVESSLREPGIFATQQAVLETAERAIEIDLSAVEPQEAVASSESFAASHEVHPEPAEVEAASEEPDSIPTAAPTARREAIFELQSIGEEVERETASEPAFPATTLEPDASSTPAATATLAALYLAQGHLDEAEREYRRVLSDRPADVEAQRGLHQIARQRASQLDESRPAGLTARRLRRLRTVYDQLRRERRQRSARVS